MSFCQLDNLYPYGLLQEERTTEQYLGVSLGSGQVLLDNLGRNEAFASIPLSWRFIEYVVHLEAIRVCFSQSVKLRLEQDVLGLDIGVDQGKFSTVQRVLQCCADDLLQA